MSHPDSVIAISDPLSQYILAHWQSTHISTVLLYAYVYTCARVCPRARACMYDCVYTLILTMAQAIYLYKCRRMKTARHVNNKTAVVTGATNMEGASASVTDREYENKTSCAFKDLRRMDSLPLAICTLSQAQVKGRPFAPFILC